MNLVSRAKHEEIFFQFSPFDPAPFHFPWTVSHWLTRLYLSVHLWAVSEPSRVEGLSYLHKVKLQKDFNNNFFLNGVRGGDTPSIFLIRITPADWLCVGHRRSSTLEGSFVHHPKINRRLNSGQPLTQDQNRNSEKNGNPFCANTQHAVKYTALRKPIVLVKQQTRS